jgi:hypothetical protein
MKERPILFSSQMVKAILEGRKTQTRRLIKPQGSYIDPEKMINCKYGKPGERLWVRETWSPTSIDYKKTQCDVIYKADFNTLLMNNTWKPSIHMPRWASRIDLEITEIGIERLRDISEEDALAEGVDGEKEAAALGLTWYKKPKSAFRFLWQQINGPVSWDENPYVWVIEFKKI